MNKARNRNFQSEIVKHRFRKISRDLDKHFRICWEITVRHYKEKAVEFYRQFPRTPKESFKQNN